MYFQYIEPTTQAETLTIPFQPQEPAPTSLIVDSEDTTSRKEKTKPKKRHRPRAEKLSAQNAHYALVLEATQLVTEIFNKRDFPCAVFGSLAAKLYGSSRFPKDVDMLVCQEIDGSHKELTAAELKKLILDSDPRHFYLKLPRDPAAEYRVLWYRQEYGGPECKVDILVPGTMYLPRLPRSRIIFLSPGIDDKPIPVVPFTLLLVHKLQGWDDHRIAEDPYYKKKQHQDAADVRKLLELRREITNIVQALGKRPVWEDKVLFEKPFQLLTKLRVKMYTGLFPDRAADWARIGFETFDNSP